MLFVRQLTLFRQVPGSAQCHATRHDGYFDQRVRPTQHPTDGGVTGFMESNGFLLFLRHDFVLALQASYDTIDGIHEILFAHFLPTSTCSDKSCFVTYIGDVCTGETRGLLAQEIQINRFVQFQRPQVNLEYLLTLLQVRQLDMYLSVKTSGTQQRCIEHVRTVGGSKDDDT